MSGLRRIRNTFLSIQDRIKALGSSNRNRWASVSMTPTITFNEFVEKVQFLGNSATADDIRCIWDSIGIPGDQMQFVDFLKFMQQDVDDFNPVESRPAQPAASNYNDGGRKSTYDDSYQEPSYTAGSKYQSNYSNDSYGYTPSNVSSGGIKGSIRQIIDSCMDLDMDMCGEITMPDFLRVCRSLGVSTDDSSLKRAISNSDPSGSGFVSYFLLAAEVCQLQSLPSAPAARYEEPPRYERPTERVNERANDRNDRVTGDALAALISRCALESAGGTRSAFNKWRGYNEKLTSADIQRGIERDARVTLNVADIEDLVSQYGGSLSLASFTRLTSGGSTPVESSRPVQSVGVPQRKMTGDEETLYEIAGQIKSDGWENIIFKSNSTDDMIRGFSRIGVNIDELKLRRLASKLGKTGLIDALKSKIQ